VSAIDNSVVRRCVTHHYACDCREFATRQLVEDLFDLAREWKQGASCAWADPHRRYADLRGEAERLGYVHRRNNRSSVSGPAAGTE
jgi:hypothetical protein